MSRPCVVQHCPNIGTHRFPKDESRRAQWIQAITHVQPGLTIRENSLICSAHFRKTDFAITPAFWKKLDRAPKILKKTSIPSVFPWKEATPQQNLATQEEPSISQLTFDKSKAQTTYARTPPVSFVEIQPLFNIDQPKLDSPISLNDTHSEIDLEDPLQDVNLVDPLQHQSKLDVESEELCMIDVTIHTEETVLPHNTEKDIVENPVQLLWLDKDDGITEIVIETDTVSVGTQTQEDIFTMQPELVSSQTQTQESSMTTMFSIYNHKDDAKAVDFYTGLETYKKFMLVFYSLGKSAYNLKYFYGPPPKKISVLEQFFITLMILRRHKTFQEMTMLYKISLKHVYTIFTTWIRFMALQWKDLDLWIDKEHVRAHMPSGFYEKYPATRCILDCTECPIKKPKLPLAQQVTFSSYKNRNTIKVLIGITPGGMISYVSPAYGGSATDRQIIERSSILNRFDYNDEIMVDKGLNVQDIFLPYGVKVNMPAFFRKGNQIKSDTLASNRKVASKRVHVERVIGMMKTYKILTEPMNTTETLLSSDIVFVIAMLVNFRLKVVNKNA